MSQPRFYSWDDIGIEYSRVLVGNAQERLKQILVQCLVTGYESKSGAGWTLGHEHSNGFSLINADGNVVNFVSDLPEQAPYPATHGASIHIYAAESLTDTSNAIIDGANLCSGTYRKGMQELEDYPRHQLGYAENVLKHGDATLQWTLVADEKTFILNCSDTYSRSGSPSNEHSFTLYVGEVILDTPVSGNFVVLGGGIYRYGSYGPMYAFSVGYTSLRDLITGLAQHVEIGTEPYMDVPYLNPTADTTFIPSRINFQQPRVVSGGMLVGRLRGVVYDDVLRAKYGWEVGLKALGFTGTDFTDRAKPVKIGDYRYAFAKSYTANSYLTDNPEFW
jgi:hypothetical protein